MVDKLPGISPDRVPGTVLSYAEVGEGMFSMFRPLIRASDGLSLGQVCAVTGLESSTVQNWVKRGFVPHPVGKKYREREFARILLISSLRECMQIDRIGDLLTAVNGDTQDEADDIVSEEALYDYLCEAVRRMDEQGVSTLSPEQATRLIAEVTADYRPTGADARARLTTALLAMVYACFSARLKRESERWYDACVPAG